MNNQKNSTPKEYLKTMQLYETLGVVNFFQGTKN